MRTFTQIAIDAGGRQACGAVALSYAEREKTRLRAVLGSGEEVAIRLPRGTVMRGGDYLLTEAGECIEVVARPEMVSTVLAQGSHALARIAYHLGNRHVWLEVGADWLRYQHDHVLDDMVRNLGGEIRHECCGFEPEAGAYSSSAHAHAH